MMEEVKRPFKLKVDNAITWTKLNVGQKNRLLAGEKEDMGTGENMSCEFLQICTSFNRK